MRIGDSVRVDNFEGVITQINARYTVVRSLAGRESIVPNEMLITNRVENLSLADSKVNLSDRDLGGLRQRCGPGDRLAGGGCDWPAAGVARDPPPAAHLSAFGADGLEFTVGLLGDATLRTGS